MNIWYFFLDNYFKISNLKKFWLCLKLQIVKIMDEKKNTTNSKEVHKRQEIGKSFII